MVIQNDEIANKTFFQARLPLDLKKAKRNDKIETILELTLASLFRSSNYILKTFKDFMLQKLVKGKPQTRS